MSLIPNLLRQQGLSLIELLIVVSISAVLIAGMQGLLGNALTIETDTRQRNDSVQQGRFAMQLMVRSARMTRRLMIPLAENTNTAYSESVRDVLAVTMDPTLDRDNDGWADANNDKDYLNINNNGTRDAGEPERIDEDYPHDMTNDGESGILGIDDDGDGLIDESNANDDDEDGNINEDEEGNGDEDGDGAEDEDSSFDSSNDNAPGLLGIDDDADGLIDEGNNDDDDEDGLRSEDWLDPVVYFLSGTRLMQRVPNINPANGSDYQENPIADNVTNFQVSRLPQGSGRAVLLDIMLEITPTNAEAVSFNTQVRVGSGL